jgi:peroxiredoxin
MPSVQRVHDAFKDTDVVVLAISVDGGGIQTVKSYVMKHGYTIPALLDTGMEVARKFGVRAVPMTYVVNRQGVVVASGFGPVDFDRPEFREYLQRVITAILIGAVLLLAVGQSLALQVGDKAPDFSLPATTAESIKLADFLGKKPVVLFFYIGAFSRT